MTHTNTTCTQCGAEVTVRDGHAYVPDTIGTLHGCLAPDPEMPDVEGEPMIFDDATSLLVPMDAA